MENLLTELAKVFQHEVEVVDRREHHSHGFVGLVQVIEVTLGVNKTLSANSLHIGAKKGAY